MERVIDVILVERLLDNLPYDELVGYYEYTDEDIAEASYYIDHTDPDTLLELMEELDAKLGRLQRTCKEKKIPVAIVFEGLGAAGKADLGRAGAQQQHQRGDAAQHFRIGYLGGRFPNLPRAGIGQKDQRQQEGQKF